MVEDALRYARGRTPAETLAARRRVIGPSLSVAYRNPVKAVSGWMQYLYDHAGRRYLDAYNNVPHVGHSHPRVVQAAIEQMLLLNTNTRYLHDSLPAFAERLTATLPAPLSVCYFVNSGSEANELALRLARAHTRRRDVIVLDAAYHGNTTTLVDISPYKFNGPGGDGAPPWVHVLPLPDTYRGKYRRDDPRAGEKYAEFARHVRQSRPPSSRRARRASAARSSCRTATSRTSTPSSAPPAASASPTKCRRRTAGWARTSTPSRRRASCPTSSCSASPSGTGIRSAPW